MFNSPFIDFNSLLYPGELISPVYNIDGLVEANPWYYVTSFGRIFSIARYKFEGIREMSPSPDGSGYLQIRLMCAGEGHIYKINRLVMFYFGGPIPQNVRKLEVNHKDLNRTNNNITNLEWTTHAENMQHSAKLGSTTSDIPLEVVSNIIDDLNNGMSCVDIGEKYGVKAYNVRNIKTGTTFAYVRPDDRHWEVRKFLDGKDIIDIYNLAKNGMPYDEIAKLYDKSEVTIEAICAIRPPYDKYLGSLPPIVKMGPKCDDETALAVYNDCKENKLTVKQICNKYGLGESLVADIKFLRHSYEPLREKYGLEPLAVNPHGTGHTIPDDIRVQIIQELKDGAKPSEIAEKYHYSESIIYRIRRNNL